jgi:hypothetical protein
MNTMWCQHCRQDVPGIASKEEGFRCSLCGCALRRGYADKDSETLSQATKPSTIKLPSQPPIEDGWELDEQLLHIERFLHTGEPSGQRASHGDRQKLTRFDSAHPAPEARYSANRNRVTNGPDRSSPLLGGLIWTALSLGTTAFVCGAVLLGWSYFADRQELWSLGLPIALGGQIALLLGLVLQLDRLWHNSRRAAAKLRAVDQQLHELKSVTTLLGTGSNSPGGAFYSHMAGGASPQILLSDLKGQLDLLAMRMAQEDRRRDAKKPH